MKRVEFPNLVVPANSSRHFTDQADALNQPTGNLKIDLDADKSFYINSTFDPKLLKHDSSYCTKDDFHMSATVHYFANLVKKEKPKLIIDIGCGAGEFVDFVRSLGIQAVGFDPVNVRPEEFFVNEYFHPELNMIPDVVDGSEIMFVMRCVLPHIRDPFEYLNCVFNFYPKARVLLEYQNLEWIIKNKIWYQFSHDHVNYFSQNSFMGHFDVRAQGLFANQEWSYCLLEKKRGMVDSNPVDASDLASQILELFHVREKQVHNLIEFNCPLGIYGAAGKGIVFGFTLQLFGAKDIAAIDVSPERQGKFMEVSGIQIFSPKNFVSKSGAISRVLVMNPEHLEYVRSNLDEKIEVITASNGNSFQT